MGEAGPASMLPFIVNRLAYCFVDDSPSVI